MAAERYIVTLLPEDFREGYLWAVFVEYRGRDLWAVTRLGECLGADGEWDPEPSPPHRDDDWLAAHRFSYGEAMRLADEQCRLPVSTSHGMISPQEAFLRESQRKVLP